MNYNVSLEAFPNFSNGKLVLEAPARWDNTTSGKHCLLVVECKTNFFIAEPPNIWCTPLSLSQSHIIIQTWFVQNTHCLYFTWSLLAKKSGAQTFTAPPQVCASATAPLLTENGESVTSLVQWVLWLPATNW